MMGVLAVGYRQRICSVQWTSVSSFPGRKRRPCLLRREAVNSAEQWEETTVEIGIIGGTHGVRGEVRVQSTSDFEEDRLGEPGIKWIEPQTMGLMKASGRTRQLGSLGGRRHIYKGHALWILRFDGINTPEEAAKLNGSKLMIRSEDRGVLPEDEFYIQQLIGLEIVGQEDGMLLGHVESVYLGNGSPDILIIKRPQNGKSKDLLLPFVSAFVPEVDLEEGRIYVTPPEGLLKLNEAKYKPNLEGPTRKARDTPVTDLL